jgi:hypothetical protein
MLVAREGCGATKELDRPAGKDTNHLVPYGGFEHYWRLPFLNQEICDIAMQNSFGQFHTRDA